MKSPRLVLLAATTGYQVRVFADAARRMGMDLTLATDRCHVLEDPWGDRAIPIRLEDARGSAELIAAQGPFDGVAAVGDRPAIVAAEAAELMGVPFHPPGAARACHNKFLARQLYQAAGLPVPSFFRTPLDEDPRALARRAPFPCVLKPLGLSASRGVIRADNPAAFVAAFERIRTLLERAPDIAATREEQNRYVQVESYIEGREFAVEGLVTGGRLKVLALFDKPDLLEGPFFEETIYVTPSRESARVQQSIVAAVEKAARALGMRHGPMHAEVRHNARGAWMLETAARPIGGLCAKSLRFSGSMTLEELVLRHAAGEDVSSIEREGCASGVMMVPIPKAGIYQSVTGVDRAALVEGIEEVAITAKEGQKLVPLPEGASYLGFIFARTDDPAAVESALREAHGRLHFNIATALPVQR